MEVVISGQAGVALTIEGDAYIAYYAGEPDTPVVAHAAAFGQLFGDARDLEFYENVDLQTVSLRLGQAYARADALLSAHFLLDSSLSPATRAEVAADLERCDCLAHVEAVLCARPLPAGIGVEVALEACEKAPVVRALFESLAERQPLIKRVWQAWLGLPDQLFAARAEQTRERRAELLSFAISQGLFLDLVKVLEEKGNLPFFKITAIQRAANYEGAVQPRNFREVFPAWVTQLSRGGHGGQSEPARESTRDRKKDKKSRRKAGKGKGSFQKDSRKETQHKVRSQKQSILTALQERRFDMVDRYLEDLRGYQTQGRNPSLFAKSLCDLAMAAKELGHFQLQLAWTRESVEIKPNDGWAWAQHGDALQKNNKLEEALAAYEQASLFEPMDVVNKNGKAEVLKTLNRLDDALLAYEEVILIHPESVVAKSGKAEVLKALGYAQK